MLFSGTGPQATQGCDSGETDSGPARFLLLGCPLKHSKGIQRGACCLRRRASRSGLPKSLGLRGREAGGGSTLWGSGVWMPWSLAMATQRVDSGEGPARGAAVGLKAARRPPSPVRSWPSLSWIDGPCGAPGHPAGPQRRKPREKEWLWEVPASEIRTSKSNGGNQKRCKEIIFSSLHRKWAYMKQHVPSGPPADGLGHTLHRSTPDSTEWKSCPPSGILAMKERSSLLSRAINAFSFTTLMTFIWYLFCVTLPSF